MAWIRNTQGGVRIQIRVTTRSKKNEVVGLRDGALKIRLQAPPRDGKANQLLVRYLAQRLGVSTARLRLVSGQRSQSKILQVDGIDLETVAASLPEAQAGVLDENRQP